jgi:hypothetical protein
MIPYRDENRGDPGQIREDRHFKEGRRRASIACDETSITACCQPPSTTAETISPNPALRRRPFGNQIPDAVFDRAENGRWLPGSL